MELLPQDIKIDTYRPGGGGGWIHKPDTCVRLTHIPTGIVVEKCDDRSVHKNKAEAMKELEILVKDAKPIVRIEEETVDQLKEKIADLEMQLALALRGLEIADGVMDYCKGDAWERECTENDRTKFAEIYETFNPPSPPPMSSVERAWKAAEKFPCDVCGKKFFNVKAHKKAKHAEGAELKGGLKVTSLKTMIKGARNGSRA